MADIILDRRDLLRMASLSAFGLVGCAKSLPTIHYRLSVTVASPKGQATGASVAAVTSVYSSAFPGPETQGLRFQEEGEATPVKLPDGQYIFVLLKWNRASIGAMHMLMDSYGLSSLDLHHQVSGDVFQFQMDEVERLAGMRGVKPVKADLYPVIGYFEDINEPTSFHSQEASKLSGLLSGCRVEGMTVEIVNADLTDQIFNILPWMKDPPNIYLDQYITQHPTESYPDYRLISPNEIMTYSFRIERRRDYK